MARPWRIEFGGAVYHVASRGNNRENIFLDDGDRSAFIDYLGRAAARFNLRIFAFCLMSNHYHLFLRTPDGNLARAMQWLNSHYTQRFHLRRRRGGHLFQGRYRAVLVEDEGHWSVLAGYIHLNPVRAELVEDPGEWRWSSFLDYTSARPRYDWVCRGEVLAGYGGEGLAARQRFRRETLALLGREDGFWRELRDAVFIGAESRWEELKRSCPPRGRVDSAPIFREGPRPVAELEAEVARAAGELGTTGEILRAGGRRGRARAGVYYHLVENCGLPVTAVADHFGVSPAAVSQGVKRLRSMLASDPALSERLSRLKFKVKV